MLVCTRSSSICAKSCSSLVEDVSHGDDGATMHGFFSATGVFFLEFKRYLSSLFGDCDQRVSKRSRVKEPLRNGILEFGCSAPPLEVSRKIITQCTIVRVRSEYVLYVAIKRIFKTVVCGGMAGC